jgi:Biotin-lipoyl like
VLPGQTEAYTDAPIFAQTSGYLKKWYFDIGAKVKAGDVLAEIERMRQESDSNDVVTIPFNALLFRAEGPAVAVVDAAGKVHIRKIMIDLNLGDTLQVSQGLSACSSVSRVRDVGSIARAV